MFDQFALTNAFRKYQAFFAKGALLTGNPKKLQVFDKENSCSSSVTFAKRMNLPYVGNEFADV